MANLQDIRRRIKSVKSTQQITNAMNMVATSRLRHAKEAAVANKPYSDKTKSVVQNIAAHVEGFSHPMLEVHESGKKLLLVIAADKGLAGAYSSNVFKLAHANIDDKNNTELVTVGRKTKDHFGHRGFSISKSWIGVSERPKYEDAKSIANYLIQRFETGEIKDIFMIYTRFVSAISCVPEIVKLLPFEHEAEDTNGTDKPGGLKSEYIYEPSAEVVLSHLLPQYLVTVIYASMLQSAASELSSRMNAMSNATDNAEELISKLNLHYNKVRQAGITNEINEIVGGANALN
ncbi:MAG: ATP synthase F1 subunit gamma [Selenomonadaceae bacterium]|nr:ATP synthase F1 subunit gamma [Selenomonadaceae bacterium]